MTVFTPRPYQRLIESFAVGRLSKGARPGARGNIFASPGMGKTTAAYSIFDSLRMLGEAERALVLAPKRVALSSWPEEREKFLESFGHLKVAAAIGTPAQRAAALRSNPDILTINYDNVEWLIEACGGVENWPFDTVFADESTRLKGLRVSIRKSSTGKTFIAGQGATRAKLLAQVAHTRVRNWFNLTGSPAPNGIVDTWGQQWFIDAGQRLGHSFSAFSDRWFRAVPGSDGYSRIEPLAFAQAEVEKLLAETSITVDARDWFPIEEVIERNIYVDLPSAARDQYAEMEKELFTLVENGIEVEALNAGSKAQKTLQIASGTLLYDEGRKWAKVHDEKIEALRSLVEETNGENLLVAYQFRADLERILKAFPRARALDDKPGTLREWNEGRIPMLVCHPASAGHGLSLQHGGRILVDYSSNFNLEYDEQVIERLGPTRQLQSGYKRSVFRYRIVARDTVEENVVLPRLKTKASVQDSLKAAMKMRKGC
jgi:SNF2 family DNA or RNA helicase